MTNPHKQPVELCTIPKNQDAAMHFEAKLAGQYKLVLTRPNGDSVETPWFDNLILDSGLHKLGASTEIVINSLQVGTGSTAVVAGQTHLNTFLAGVNMAHETTTPLGEPLYKAEHLYKAIFAQGAVVGNITEVGTGSDIDGTADLFSRSLIVDEEGVPTALTIVALDQLTVYYKLTVTPPLTDGAGSFVIGGVTYNYTSRMARIESFSSGYYLGQSSDYFSLCQLINAYTGVVSLSPITGNSVTGESIGGSSFTEHVSYNPGTRTRVTRVTFSIDAGNSPGGITGFDVVYTTSYFQYVLDAAIPKTNTKVLTLDVSFSWSRG